MKTKSKRQTSIQHNGNGNGHHPAVLSLAEAKELLTRCIKQTSAGRKTVSIKAIETDMPAEWAMLKAKWSFPSIAAHARKIHSDLKSSPKPKAQTSPMLQFCPCCGTPIGALIKAVNALANVRGGGMTNED